MNHKTEAWFQTKLAPWLKKDKLVIVLLTGILLLVISLPTGKQKKSTDAFGGKVEVENVTGGRSGVDSGTMTGTSEDELQGSDASYLERLEKELEELLEQVEGAGKVRVMITLEQSEELVVLKNLKETQRQTEENGSGKAEKKGRETIMEENAVYDEASKGKSPYVVTKIYPRIQGVIVIAQGAGTGRVSMELTEAVQALFGLEAHKIKVLKLGLSK